MTLQARLFVFFVMAASLAFATAGIAQDPTAIYSGRDRFHPVLAENGMVASQEATATRIGLDILRNGGNAVDAAVAVGFTLAVTLPRAGNLGGGGFMIVHDAETGETVALDYREVAGAAATRDMYLDEEGNADPQLSRFSELATGVPGTVAGLALAHERYGSGRFTLAELIEPARRLAAEGIVVTADLAASLAQARERLGRHPSSEAIFFHEDGSLYEPGERLVQEDLAESLGLIAEQGSSAFYDGPIGQAIVDQLQAGIGILTMEDFRSYEPVIREPVRGSYRGHDIVSMPPPSSGGVHIIQILNILETVPVGHLGHNAAETLHWMAEAMKLAYADRSEYLGDPDFVEVPVAGLTSPDYAEALRGQIDPNRARPAEEIAPGDPIPYESDETTHFSIVDRDGNAVANTYTLNFSYGSGLVAEETGILLNNELDDFSAKPGVPNAYGLIGGEANAVEPGKRPLSSMSPTMVFRDGELLLVTGSPGGSRIITTTLQMIMNVIDHDMNVAEATAAVRVHHQWLPDELRIEEGLNPDTVRLLSGMGHRVVVRDAMGSTQSILALPDSVLTGASDPRRPGALTAGY